MNSGLPVIILIIQLLYRITVVCVCFVLVFFYDPDDKTWQRVFRIPDVSLCHLLYVLACVVATFMTFTKERFRRSDVMSGFLCLLMINLIILFCTLCSLFLLVSVFQVGDAFVRIGLMPGLNNVSSNKI